MPKVISRSEALEKNLKYYYTGKPCIKGHTSKRETRKSDCIECKKIYFKNRLILDKEKLKKYRIKYEKTEKDKIVKSIENQKKARKQKNWANLKKELITDET